MYQRIRWFAIATWSRYGAGGPARQHEGTEVSANELDVIAQVAGNRDHVLHQAH
jgi:hypothetical protein